MRCIFALKRFLSSSYFIIIFGLLLTPKNICQNINFAILYVKTSNIYSENEIENFLRAGLLNFNFTFSTKMYNYSTTVEGLGNLNTIFSDNSIDVVIASSPYDFVNILSDFANQYNKLLIVNNNNFPLLDESKVIFIQTGFKLATHALTGFLEWFQWSNIAVIVSEETYWEHMAVSVENELLKRIFTIKHSIQISNLTDDNLFETLVGDINTDEKGKCLLSSLSYIYLLYQIVLVFAILFRTLNIFF